MRRKRTRKEKGEVKFGKLKIEFISSFFSFFFFLLITCWRQRSLWVGQFLWPLKLPVVYFSRYTYFTNHLNELIDPSSHWWDCSLYTIGVERKKSKVTAVAKASGGMNYANVERRPKEKKRKEYWTSCRFIFSIIPLAPSFLFFSPHSDPNNWIK